MTIYLTNDEDLTSVADAIREKGGTSAALTYPSEFISAIAAIETTPDTQTKTVNPSESIQTVEPDSGKLLSSVTVTAVSSDYIGSNIARNSAADLTASGSQVTVPSGYYSLEASKAINAGSATTPATVISIVPTISINTTTGVITATAAGSSDITPTIDTGYISVGTPGVITINGSNTSSLSTVAAVAITPTESSQTAVAANKYTLGAITVDAISSNYVGSNITARSSASLTASGSTITAPAGYYAAAAAKNVDAGSATTPATTISITPTISLNTSTGVITATAAGSSNVTPTISTGYISAGTSGKITISGSQTSNLSTQAAKTVTPSESSQTAVAAGKYTTGAVTVGAVSSNYVGSNIARNSASDLTASGSVVTVPAGYYSAQATKAVAAGTAGTPTATKGTVSNHAISVTPKVTNTAGYIAAATKTGTAVSVAASELVSGTLTITDNGTFDVTTYASASVNVGVALPSFTYTGTYETIDDGSGNWRIKFKTSGTFKITSTHGRNVLYDIFCVGGGGGGKSYDNVHTYWGHAGGGGGYTKTVTNQAISVNTNYTVTVGAGGAVDGRGGTSSFGSLCSAAGGYAGVDHDSGGNGGSGGGGGANNAKAGNGGSGGGNGGAGGGNGGTGQGTSPGTREFGSTSTSVTLYSGGGGGGTSSTTSSNCGTGGSGGGGKGAYADGASAAGTANTGGGGGGCSAKNGASSKAASAGGSGIVIIRNHR